MLNIHFMNLLNSVQTTYGMQKAFIIFSIKTIYFILGVFYYLCFFLFLFMFFEQENNLLVCIYVLFYANIVNAPQN